MAHKRTTIAAAFAALLTGLSSTGQRVYLERTRPLGDAELPAIVVREGGEDEPSTTLANGLPVGRQMRIATDIVVKATESAAQTSNQILSEIEAALFASVASNTLSGLASGIRMASIDDPEMDDSTEKPARRLTVIFRVNYS